MVNDRLVWPRSALLWFALVVCSAAVAAASLTMEEVVRTLAASREGNRQSAIASLARSGQIPSPIAAADGAAILQGATQGARAGAIGELAALFKADLSGQEAEAILGPEATLSEGNRQTAIAAIARAKRFGPSLGEDAALALKGATQGARAGAIGEIAPYLRQGLSGQSLAAILGDAIVLTDGNRQSAVASLARAGRIRQCITAAESSLLMVGAKQGSRAGAIGEIARFVGPILQVADLARLLGTGAELSEGNRISSLAALARSGAVHRSFSVQELDAILSGTTGKNRISATAEITNATAPTAQMVSACAKDFVPSSGTVAGNASGAPASGPASGTSTAAAPGNGGSGASPAGAPSSAQGLQDRIGRLRTISNNFDPYAFGADTLVDQVNLVAMDLPRMLGSLDFRAMYEQSYFGALQYRILANRTLDRAQRALRLGNTDEAQRQADHATTLIQQERNSLSAAQAALDRDATRATAFVRMVYETSKATSSIVAKVSHIPGATAAVDSLWVLTDAGISAADDGLAAGEKEFIADVVTKVVMKKVPIDILGGKTIENVLDGTAGKLISDTGIRAAVRKQLADPAVRKTIIVAVKQAVSDALGKAIEAKFNAAIDNAISGIRQGG